MSDKKSSNNNPSSKKSNNSKYKNPKDAASSEEFQKTRRRADQYKKDPEKVKKLMDDVEEKIKDDQHRGPLGEMWKYLTTLIRLVKAYFSGKYTIVPWESIALALTAIIYFVSPVDLIPDFIPVVGYLDDAFVIAFVVKAIKADLDNFLDWESQQSQAKTQE